MNMRLKLNWGHAITAVYTTFAVATLSFVVFAVGHPAELVSADYYAQSLEHDERQGATARASAQPSPASGRVSDDGHSVIISVPRTTPSSSIAGEVRLYRPSSAKNDQRWSIAVDRDGRQILPTKGLPPGRWILQIDWREDGIPFYAELPVVLP
jgi:hypothetical protein